MLPKLRCCIRPQQWQWRRRGMKEGGEGMPHHIIERSHGDFGCICEVCSMHGPAHCLRHCCIQTAGQWTGQTVKEEALPRDRGPPSSSRTPLGSSTCDYVYRDVTAGKTRVGKSWRLMQSPGSVVASNSVTWHKYRNRSQSRHSYHSHRWEISDPYWGGGGG